MSTRSIDERIVEMRFDNEQFESGAKKTLGTLDKLKQSLKFDKAAEGLSTLERAGRGFSLSSVTSAAEAVANRFSTMGIIGVTALQRVVNQAMDAGSRVAKAFTIDPVRTGFSEYETQINAVQTILSNTKKEGATLEDVNRTLDELNTYADKTIYNFTEMTRNIGTFTAAGVDLKTSTTAIKGIANLAAISGSTSQQASTAMYQLSQALASGTVKLMDWNSVVNAGMGGQVFQDALKETARLHGIKIDEMIDKHGSFRETLQEGWLTSAVLTDTLQKFTGDLTQEQLISMGYTKEQAKAIYDMGVDANEAATKVKTFTQLFDTMKEAAQSGWSQSWRIVVGDFEEAKSLLTDVSDAFGALINKTSESRNLMLVQWKDLGGRTKLIESFKNVFAGLSGILTSVKAAFRSIFPKTTGQNLKNLTDKIYNATEAFKKLFWFKEGYTAKAVETSEGIMLEKNAFYAFSPTLLKITKIFKGLFAVVDIGFEVIKQLGSSFFSLIGFVAPAGNGLLDFMAAIGDNLVSLRNYIKETGTFKISFDGLTAGIKPFLDTFKAFSEEGLSGIDAFVKSIETHFTGFATLKEYVTNLFGGFWKTITEKIGGFNLGTVFSLLKGVMMIKALKSVKNFFDSFSNILGDGEGLLGKFSGIFETVKTSLESWQSSLNAGNLLKIAAAVTLLAGSMFVLAGLDPTKLAAALGAITGLFADLFGSLAIFGKFIGGGNFKSLGTVSRAMIGIAASVLILSFAMKKLADLEWEGIAKGLVGIAGLTGIMIASIKILSGASGVGVRSAVGFVILAYALGMLVDSVKKFENISPETIIKGLVGIGAILAELILFTKMTGGANFDGMEIGLAILGFALDTFVSAIERFSSIPWDDIKKGLLGIGGILLEMGIFTKFAGGSKGLITTSIGLVILGGAVHIFVSAIEKFNEMSWDTIKKGLAGIGAILLELAIFSKLIGGSKKLISSSLGFVILGGAIHIFVTALSKFSEISWDTIQKGLTGIGAILAGLVVFSKLTGGAKKVITTAIGFTILGGAMMIFSKAITELGNMTWEDMGKGLLGIGAVLAELAVFTKLTGGAKGVITTSIGLTILSGAMIIFGKAVEKFGEFSLGTLGKTLGSLALLAASMFILSKMPITGTITAIGNLGVALGGLAGIVGIAGAINAIPGFDWLMKSGGEALGLVGTAIGKFIHGIFNPYGTESANASNSSKLADLGTGLDNFVTSVTPFIEKVKAISPENLNHITAVSDTITGLIGAANILENSPGAASALTTFSSDVIAFGTNLALYAESVAGIDQAAVEASANAVTILSNMASGIPNSGGLVALFTGDNNIADFGDDIVSLGASLLKYSLCVAGIDESKVTASANAAKVLTELANQIPDSGGIVSLFSGDNNLADFADDIVSFGAAMLKYSLCVAGIDDAKVTASANAAKSLAELATNLPDSGGIKQFIEGKKDMVDFAAGVAEMGPSLKTYADSVSGMKTTSITASANAAKTLAEFARNLPSTGGIKQFLEGQQDIGLFATGIAALGPSIKTYIDSVSGLKYTDVQNSIDAISILDEFATNLDPTGGLFESIAKFFTGDKDIVAYSRKLADFGMNMSEFAGYFSGTGDNDPISTAVTKVSTLLSELAALFGTGEGSLQLDYSSVSNLGAIMLQLTDELVWYAPYFDTSGETIMVALSNGMSRVTNVLPASMSDLMWRCKMNIENYYYQFYNSGLYIIQGVANGIIANAATVTTAASTVASRALAIFNRTLGINSPSREFMKSGMYSDQGAALGFTKYAYLVDEAAKKVGTRAIGVMRSALSSIDSIVNNELGFNPVITPVIDASQIASGMNTVNGMLGNRMINVGGINAGVLNRTAAYAAASMGQNGYHSVNESARVAQAIDNLNGRMDEMTQTISKLKVVLDSGATVGQLKSEFNRQMGRQMTYDERGM